MIKREFPDIPPFSYHPLCFPSFLLNMTAFPDYVRNVAVVGHLHHGKTALMDMLVFETHKIVWDSDNEV